MKKLLTGLVLPLFALTALMGTANAQISPITSSSVNVSEANTLNFVLTTQTAMNGGTLTIYARSQDGTPIPFTGGTISNADDMNDPAMNMTVDAPGTPEGSLSYVTALNLPAGFNAAITATLANPATAQNVSILAYGSNGDAAGTTFAIAGADTVNITAVVESTLSMDILTTENGVDTNNNITFGVLPLGAIVNSLTNRNQQTDITIRTNATGGYTLNAAAGSLGANKLVEWATAFNTMATNTEGFALEVVNTDATPSVGLGDGTGALVADTAVSLVSGPATPGDTTTVAYAVAIATDTAVGMYEETITYSVTASF